MAWLRRPGLTRWSSGQAGHSQVSYTESWGTQWFFYFPKTFTEAGKVDLIDGGKQMKAWLRRPGLTWWSSGQAGNVRCPTLSHEAPNKAAVGCLDSKHLGFNALQCQSRSTKLNTARIRIVKVLSLAHDWLKYWIKQFWALLYTRSALRIADNVFCICIFHVDFNFCFVFVFCFCIWVS